MRKIIKICSPQLGVSPSSTKGGEIYDYETLKGFTKSKIKMYVYLPRNRNYDKNLDNFYVEYSLFQHIFPPVLYSLICLPYLFRTYKKEKFDVLRIHSPRFLGIAGLIFNFFHPNVPIVCSSVSPKPPKYLKWVERRIYAASSKIIVQSEYMKNNLVRDFNIHSKKIINTYGGISKQKNAVVIPKEASLISSDDEVLLFMGSMDERKNPIFLLEVLKMIVNKIPNVKIVFIGTGNQQKEIKDKVARESLRKNIILIDKAFAGEKSYWFSRMAVFLMPSKNEGLGLALVEAMSWGKPVVASTIPPFREIIISGKDGFLLPTSANLWSKKITEILENKNLRQKISAQSKAKVEKKYSWERAYTLNEKTVIDILN